MAIERNPKTGQFGPTSAPLKHGSNYTYNLGCRCTECKDRHNLYQREYRANHPLFHRATSQQQHAAEGTCRWCRD